MLSSPPGLCPPPTPPPPALHPPPPRGHVSPHHPLLPPPSFLRGQTRPCFLSSPPPCPQHSPARALSPPHLETNYFAPPPPHTSTSPGSFPLPPYTSLAWGGHTPSLVPSPQDPLPPRALSRPPLRPSPSRHRALLPTPGQGPGRPVAGPQPRPLSRPNGRGPGEGPGPGPAPTFDHVAVDGGAELLAGRPVPVLPVDDPHLLEEGGLAALARAQQQDLDEALHVGLLPSPRSQTHPSVYAHAHTCLYTCVHTGTFVHVQVCPGLMREGGTRGHLYQQQSLWAGLPGGKWVNWPQALQGPPREYSIL
uniref:Uncharacterized protein n=1 Tax=Terrapene triunguis TaxID=2587831 RepID=A0A674I8R7_9SAUR